MMNMLTDCALFRPVDNTLANYYQLSGPPISDLEIHPDMRAPSSDIPPVKAKSNQTADRTGEGRTPCKVAFVRSRMLYAKPALNAKGDVRFGLRHIRQ